MFYLSILFYSLSFVYYLLKRHFPDEADSIVKNMDWLDTLTVVKDRKEYPHKLIDAVEHYGIEKVRDTKIYKECQYNHWYSSDNIHKNLCNDITCSVFNNTKQTKNKTDNAREEQTK